MTAAADEALKSSPHLPVRIRDSQSGRDTRGVPKVELGEQARRSEARAVLDSVAHLRQEEGPGAWPARSGGAHDRSPLRALAPGRQRPRCLAHGSSDSSAHVLSTRQAARQSQQGKNRPTSRFLQRPRASAREQLR